MFFVFFITHTDNKQLSNTNRQRMKNQSFHVSTSRESNKNKGNKGPTHFVSGGTSAAGATERVVAVGAGVGAVGGAVAAEAHWGRPLLGPHHQRHVTQDNLARPDVPCGYYVSGGGREEAKNIMPSDLKRGSEQVDKEKMEKFWVESMPKRRENLGYYVRLKKTKLHHITRLSWL